MSLALYRRYRPETFAQVIGQEHVTDPLQQALRNNRVNHAYLFSGPRGCGKTTSARILARCLNCEQGPTPTPCGQCRSCQDLATGGGGSIDVIEIDAASHGGVDDARDLREKAFFAPVSSRYKIYIVDEAHMVTSAGFNALLKVVEEPPEHLKFIFATTEPEKVIGTIRSRTHHYPFRLVPPGVLRDYLEEVCGREGIRVEPEVLPLVVRAGAGSVRDSMSVMDQLLAGAGEEGVTYAMATSLLGYTDRALLDEVTEAFGARDGAAAFRLVDRVIEGGYDPRRFVADLLERLRDLVVLAAVPDAAEKGLVDAPADQLERMREQARAFGTAELTRAADIVNTGLTEMRGATSPRLQLELVCARVLLPGADTGEAALHARLEQLERRVAQGAVAAVAQGMPALPPAVPQAPGPVAQAPVPPPAAEPQSAYPQAGQPSAGQPQAGPAEPARRPGSWPGARTAAPAQVPAPAAGHAAAPQRQPYGQPDAQQHHGTQQRPAPQQSPQQHAAPAPAAPAPAAQAAPAGGGVDPATLRQMWDQILAAVERRRRFTWILLKQNAQLDAIDGSTMRIVFANAGARDRFTGGGSDEVLRQTLIDLFGVEWRVDAVVDPARDPGAGGGRRPGGSGPHGRPQSPGAAAPARGPHPAPAAGQPQRPGAAPGRAQGAPAATQSAGWPAAVRPGGGGGAAEPVSPGGGAQAQAPRPAPEAAVRRPAVATGEPAVPLPPEPPAEDRYDAYEPPPVAPEDDVADFDDPDVDDDGMSTHELLVRELGATVIEETRNG